MYIAQAKYEELELRVTSMTRTYLDPRTRPQALAMILADFNSMDRSSCSSGGGGDDAISDESLYAQNLKRSVVLESWAASDYDPRQHHAYCEVSCTNIRSDLISSFRNHVFSALIARILTANLLLQLSIIFTVCRF
jgi:hypothetical protein